MQHMRIESPRKTLHYSKREELQFRITNLVLSKCRSKAYKNQSKAKQKAKADVVVVEKFRLQASTSFKKKIHSREGFRKVAFSVIVFVWMIAVSVTKKLQFCVDGVLDPVRQCLL